MKNLLITLLLAGAAYGGYLYYRQSSTAEVISNSERAQPQLIITQASDSMGNLASVLGASITNLVEDSKTLLSDATNGASEPVVNQLVSKTQETLKDLPKREAERIKYEFCKSIVSDYEEVNKND